MSLFVICLFAVISGSVRFSCLCYLFICCNFGLCSFSMSLFVICLFAVISGSVRFPCLCLLFVYLL